MGTISKCERPIELAQKQYCTESILSSNVITEIDWEFKSSRQGLNRDVS